jgi:hypothetical protein
MSAPNPQKRARRLAKRRRRQAERRAWREGQTLPPAPPAGTPRVHRNATCPFCRTWPADPALEMEMGGPGGDITFRLCRHCADEFPRLLARHGITRVQRIAERGLAALGAREAVC